MTVYTNTITKYFDLNISIIYILLVHVYFSERIITV